MWRPKESKLVKVLLQDRGADAETPWAEDLGPVGDAGAHRVRLANIPALHAKPTYEDVIIVEPGKGFMTWDRNGVAWEDLPGRIEEHAGRWPMIVDYLPHKGADSNAIFGALDVAAERLEGVP